MSRQKKSLPAANSRNFNSAVKELIELREGVRSGWDSAFVTFKELKDYDLSPNLSSISGSGPVVVGGDPPNPPGNLVVTAWMLGNDLVWTQSTSTDTRYYEVWCATSQDRSLATLLAVVPYPTTFYHHALDATEVVDNHYYWIRAVNWSGLYSTWEPSDALGGYLVTGVDTAQGRIDDALAILNGQITESELYADLNDRIDLIDTPITGFVDQLENYVARAMPFDDSISWALNSLTLYNNKIYRAKANLTPVVAIPTNTTYWDLVGSYSSMGDLVYSYSVTINDHEVRIGGNEGDISAHASSISALETTVNDPITGVAANASAISSLDTRVTTNEGDIDTHATSISGLQSDVDGLDTTVSGHTSAISGLDTRVTTNEGNISAHASSISALETTVDDPATGVSANASAIGSLDTRVTTNEGNISAHASSISTLQTTVGGHTTSIGTNATAIDGIEGKYTVKIDNNGVVSGYGLISTANEFENEIDNPDLELWADGAALAPDDWTLVGSGASVARSETAKRGQYAAQITAAGASAYLSQAFHGSRGIDYWKGKSVAAGAWVKCSASSAFVAVKYTYGASSTYTEFSSAHTGDGEWQWLTATVTAIPTDATSIEILLYVSIGESAFYDGAIVVQDDELTSDMSVTSQFGVVADSFFIAKPGYGNVIPFIISDVDGVTTIGINGELVVDGSIYARSITVTELSALSADLGTITAGTIQSSNWSEVPGSEAGFEIDLTTHTITIYDAGGLTIKADGGLKLIDNCGLIFQCDGSDQFDLKAYWESGVSVSTLILSPKTAVSSRIMFGDGTYGYEFFDIYADRIQVLHDDYPTSGFGLTISAAQFSYDNNSYDNGFNYDATAANGILYLYGSINPQTADESCGTETVPWGTVRTKAIKNPSGTLDIASPISISQDVAWDEIVNYPAIILKNLDTSDYYSLAIILENSDTSYSDCKVGIYAIKNIIHVECTDDNWATSEPLIHIYPEAGGIYCDDLTIYGDLTAKGDIEPWSDGVYDLGSSSWAFDNLYIQNISNPNGDLSINAETFEYEIGTWTPAIEFGGATTGITYNASRAGHYTALGDQVIIQAHFSLSSKGTATGAARIVGLPFTANSSNGYLSPVNIVIRDTSRDSGEVFQAFVVPDTDEIQIEAVTAAGVDGTLTDADFTDDTHIWLTAIYYPA